MRIEGDHEPEMQPDGVELDGECQNCVADERVERQRHGEDAHDEHVVYEDLARLCAHARPIVARHDVHGVVDEVAARHAYAHVCQLAARVDHVRQQSRRLPQTDSHYEIIEQN